MFLLSLKFTVCCYDHQLGMHKIILCLLRRLILGTAINKTNNPRANTWMLHFFKTFSHVCLSFLLKQIKNIKTQSMWNVVYENLIPDFWQITDQSLTTRDQHSLLVADSAISLLLNCSFICDFIWSEVLYTIQNCATFKCLH